MLPHARSLQSNHTIHLISSAVHLCDSKCCIPDSCALSIMPCLLSSSCRGSHPSLSIHLPRVPSLDMELSSALYFLHTGSRTEHSNVMLCSGVFKLSLRNCAFVP